MATYAVSLHSGPSCSKGGYWPITRYNTIEWIIVDKPIYAVHWIEFYSADIFNLSARWTTEARCCKSHKILGNNSHRLVSFSNPPTYMQRNISTVHLSVDINALAVGWLICGICRVFPLPLYGMLVCYQLPCLRYSSTGKSFWTKSFIRSNFLRMIMPGRQDR